MLTGKGVTAWRRALASLTSASPKRTSRHHRAGIIPPQAPLPEPVATELIHALAGLAVALAGTIRPSPIPPHAAGKEHPVLPDTASSKVTAAHLSRTALLLLGSSANVQVRMGVVCGRRR